MGAAPVPATLPRAELVWTPTLADNTELPTCTVAGLANSLRAWALEQGFDVAITEQALLQLFADVAGCAPTVEAIKAMPGLVMTALLDHVTRVGFECGLQVPVGLSYSVADHTNLAALRDAIFVRGSGYVGVTLYGSDVQPDPVWRGAPRGAPVGGHCIVPYRFGAAGFGSATWGETLGADDTWMRSRIEEVYALAWLLPVAP